MSIVMGFMSGSQGYAQTVVQGDITTDTTWSSDVLLKGPVFVRKPAMLTIQAGVEVKGEKATLGALVIDQGAKLIAIGTENNPVVLTSDQPAEQKKRGDWGGLILNGYSPLNLGTVGFGEGDTGYYGCDEGLGIPCNEQDNSGTLQYVRVEYSGIQFSPDNEMNGIAFQGTGSGTTVDHVQVHYSKDDGIEMFGGFTNIKYAIISGCADDSFDWTHGYRGNVQFVVVQHQCDTGECDKGMEADNLDKNYDALPRSKPTMYNFTLIGDPINGSQTVSTNGMLLRRGTAATIRNFIVQGFNRSGIDIDNTPTILNAQNGELTVSNSIWWMNDNNNMNFYDDADDVDINNYPFTTNQFMTGMMQNNVVVNPLLPNPYDWTDPDFHPATNSPAGNGQVPVAAPPQGNTFIVATNYMGAIDPNGDDWTRKPWTTFGVRQETTTTTTVSGTTTTVSGTTTTTTVSGTTTTSAPTSTTTTTVKKICAASQVLGEDNPQLDILRYFRDTVMARSLKGKIYTRLYYQYSDQVSEIFEADPSLKAQAAALLASALPAVERALECKTVMLTKTQKEQALAVLNKIGKNSSFGLRLAIMKLKSDIRRGSVL
jgi:hypothetical protein